MADAQDLFDERLEDLFRAALYQLVRAVERERGPGAVELVARWAGRRPSTIYAWMEGASTPSRWQDVARLSIRSTEAGLTQIAAFLVAATMRLALFGSAMANGCLRDEMDDLLRIGAQLVECSHDNDGERTQQLAEDLHGVADRIRAEGALMMSQRASTSKVRKIL